MVLLTTINNVDLTSEKNAFTGFGHVTLNNGIIKTKETSISLVGSSTINDGEIISSNGGVSADSVTVNGGTINAKNTAVSSSDGTLTVTDGTIISKESDGAYAGGYGSITGGTIIGKRGLFANYHTTIYTIVCSNVTINGGQIIGTDGDGVYSHCGTLTIGDIEDSIKPDNESTGIPGTDYEFNNLTWPEIVGTNYGVNVNTSDFNYFDGVLKGKVSAHDGLVTLVPDASMIENIQKDLS